MSNDTVRNVTPFHMEVKYRGNGKFSLWFYSPIGDDYRRRNITKIHFEPYWLKVIADSLWDVFGKKHKEIDDDYKTLRGDK